MNVLFFAFANDPAHPLRSLHEEAISLYDKLSPRQFGEPYWLHKDEFATQEKLAHFLIQYKDRIVLFHYSGHAKRDSLMMEGIIELLGQCPNLKLVFINGCATLGQVQALQEQGIPGILASSSVVEDRMATEFSVQFYGALSRQYSLVRAFDSARDFLLAEYATNLNIKLHRKLPSDVAERKSIEAEESLWRFFVEDNRDDILVWKLPSKLPKPPQHA